MPLDLCPRPKLGKENQQPPLVIQPQDAGGIYRHRQRRGHIVPVGVPPHAAGGPEPLGLAHLQYRQGALLTRSLA